SASPKKRARESRRIELHLAQDRSETSARSHRVERLILRYRREQQVAVAGDRSLHRRESARRVPDAEIRECEPGVPARIVRRQLLESVDVGRALSGLSKPAD